MVTGRYKFDTLQETSERHILNDDYENFVTGHIEAAADWIITKPSAKFRVPWKSLIARKNEITLKKNILTQLKKPNKCQCTEI